MLKSINELRLSIFVLSSVICSLPLFSCSLKDSQRCSKGQRYEGKLCYVVEDANAIDVDVETDSATAEEGEVTAEEGGQGSDTGIGTACSQHSDCEGLTADYCATNPATKQGICTIQNCTPSTSDCPKGYTCCKLTIQVGYPDLCIPDDQWQTQHANGFCS